MSDKIKLTLTERYNIIKYAYQLPCNTALRLNFDPFVELLELNDDEVKAGYSVSTENGSMVVSDEKYTREYSKDEFPEVVLNAIKNYVDDMNDAISGDKPLMDKDYVQSVTKWLSLVI